MVNSSRKVCGDGQAQRGGLGRESRSVRVWSGNNIFWTLLLLGLGPTTNICSIESKDL